MRNLLIVSAVAVMLGVSVVAQAAEAKPDPKVVQKIEQGLKAYKDGKNAEATAALQEALVMLQKANASGLEAFFPAAPAGWEAGKVSSNTMSMTGPNGAFSYTTLNRNYEQKKDKDGQQIAMTLISSPEMVAMRKPMIDTFTNAEMLKMLNTDGNTVKAINQDGWAGWLQVEKGGKAMAMMFQGPLMLQLDGKTDAATLEKFIKTIDLKGLAAQDKTAAPAAPAKKAEK